VDLHSVFNAILYVLREGCRWRALPRDFPNWNTVYYHFRKWKKQIDPSTGLPLLGRYAPEKITMVFDSATKSCAFLSQALH
jgi:hypothetical protein